MPKLKIHQSLASSFMTDNAVFLSVPGELVVQCLLCQHFVIVRGTGTTRCPNMRCPSVALAQELK